MGKHILPKYSLRVYMGFVIFYLVPFFLVYSGIYNDIKISAAAANNPWKRLLISNGWYMLAAIICFMPSWKVFKSFKRKEPKYYLAVVMAAALFGSLLFTDVDSEVICQMIRCLFFVGMLEEIIFRGFLYNVLLPQSKVLAVVVSGFCYGISWDAVRALLNGGTPWEIFVQAASGVLGGIAMGALMVFFYERGGTLLLPIFIHAVLMYPYMSFSVKLVLIIIISIIITVHPFRKKMPIKNEGEDKYGLDK